MPILIQGQKWGSPLSPPLWSQVPFSATGTHRGGTKGIGGNIIGPGEPKKSCLWLTGPFEALPLVGGHTPGAGDRPEQYHWPGSSFVIAFGCGVEGRDLGTKPSGQEDMGQGSCCSACRPHPCPQQCGQDWCRSPARGKEPMPEGRWQGTSHVRSPPPRDCPSQCLYDSQVDLGAAHCSSSQEGFSAPGGLSLMLNCCRVCSSCFWFPAK